ncbi:SIS domain-containing protein [Streptomyces morookaense]|uniref:SIS domain-containing protein n=1 Tax=Streptomyces morookaense TaxID=1970 RepID=A0A7Y7B1F6_STRMO|nr:SIS domain-containing protein [Streptomyces morookaense]NVK77273.1 SIS domain-containing protein [Streptomyces morookaense]
MSSTPVSRTAVELATQPACWRRAAAHISFSPDPGERIAVTGCGTSWFMAQAYAALRESSGRGETDAFPSSEFPAGRRYDRVVAITRSGTTTEVLRVLDAVRGRIPTVAITADAATPVRDAADEAVVLDWADEQSVVQTRFATTALAYLRAGLGPGDDVTAAAADAEAALRAPLPAAAVEAEQWTFLGAGWTYGLAQEAALKMREAAGAWTEAYPAMEYRHGPIAVARPGRVVWAFGPMPEGLAEDVAGTGALLITGAGDPMADLVRVHRLAVAVAERRGLSPDAPRGLTRSVILAP